MAATKQTVLITGAGRGIGRASALRFAARGFSVVLTSRTTAELAETAQLLGGKADNCLAVTADVSAESDVQRLIASAKDRFGRIDILVNNAGIAPLSSVADMTTDVFDRLIGVNVRGVFLTCREVWPVMTAGGGGTIINVSSLSASSPFPGLSAYGGSKAFVETFTRGLADEGRDRNIRVFAVAPGAVGTRMLLDLFPDFPRDQMLDPDAVAGLIEWLCDPRCQACTGETFKISQR